MRDLETEERGEVEVVRGSGFTRFVEREEACPRHRYLGEGLSLPKEEMPMRRLLTLSLALALSFAGALAAQDDAGRFTAGEKSAEALHEAVLMSTSKLVQEFGPADAVLAFSGKFSDGGWEASLSGEYAGQPVDLAFSATYNDESGEGRFTSTGTYGADGTWEGTGSWRYEQVDDVTLNMFWDSEAIIRWLRKLFRPDKHFTDPKRWARSRLPDGSIHVVDSGTYVTTYFGIPFGRKKQQISDWVYPPGGGGTVVATVSVELPEDGVTLTAYVDMDNGTTGGKLNLSSDIIVDPVPEEIKKDVETRQGSAAKAGVGQ